MTREKRKKAIEVLDDMKVKIDILKAAKTQNDRNWALDVAIQALSQEPCDDAISRETVIKVIKSWFKKIELNPDILVDSVISLPSVTPKSGKWIEERDDYGEIQGWHCSECYEDTGFTTDCKWKYCPNCGARMVEPQERSDKE